MTIYSYFFTSDETKALKSLLTFDQDKLELKNPDILPEIEIRIGKLIGNKFINQYDKDDKQDKKRIEILLDRLINNLNCQYEYIDDKVEIKGNEIQIRKITNNKSGQVIFEKKIKKLKTKTDENITVITELTKDKNQYKTTENIIRFSKNYEFEAKEVEFKLSKELVYNRNRKRHNFIFFNYIISITLINDKFYEIEIEFSKEFVQNITNDKINGFSQFIGIMKQSLQNIYFTLHSLFSSKYYIQYNMSKTLSFLSSSSKDIRPINIQNKHINNDLFNKYAITNKLDGAGYDFCFVKEGTTTDILYSLYLINNKDVIKVGILLQKEITNELKEIINKQYIFKSEVLFLENDKVEIFIFDVVLSTKLLKRIEIINSSIKSLNKVIFSIERFNKYKINVKNYLTNIDGDAIDNLNTLYNSLDLSLNDGIILTSYNDYEDKEFPPLKWKNPNMVSIDFLLKKVEYDAKYVKYMLQTKNNINGKMILQTYINPITNKPIYIELDNKDIIDGLFADHLDDLVGEIIYNKGNFEIFRIRWDKDESKVNFITVANDTIQDMYHPLTFDDLINLLINFNTKKQEIVEMIKNDEIILESLQKNEKIISNLANKVKLEIIKDYVTKGDIILDIGSGKGGDLFKYKHADVKEIYMVEPNNTFINELEKRIKRDNFFKENENYNIINASGTDNLLIRNEMKGKKANVVSMFFSLTYFFESKETLEKLLNTIDENLNEDGYFIGTVMIDQNIINELLNQNIITEDYKIKNININSNKVFGNSIFIDLKDSKTAQNVNEFLVSLNQLIFELSFYNLVVDGLYKFKDYLKDYPNASENDKKFISNFIGFSFKRIRKQIFTDSIQQPLPIDENYYFYRIKTESDGSCLFHSILKSLLKEDYIDPKNQIKLFRENLSNAFTIEDFKNIKHPLPIIEFKNYISEFSYKCIYDSIEYDKTKKDKNKLKNILDEIISYEHEGIDNLIYKLVDRLSNEFKFDRIELTEFYEGILYKLFLEYKISLKNCNEWADVWSIEFLCNYLKINIISIDVDNLNKYEFIYDISQPYILVANIDNKHFESIIYYKNIRDDKYETIFDFNFLNQIPFFFEQNKLSYKKNTFSLVAKNKKQVQNYSQKNEQFVLKNYISPKNLNQMNSLYNSPLKERFLNFITRNVESSENVKDKVIKMLKNNQNDMEIYTELLKYRKVKDADKRSKGRIRDIKFLTESNEFYNFFYQQKPFHYLDFGGAEGSISHAIGKYLDLPNKNIYSFDLETPESSTVDRIKQTFPINYITGLPNDILPFEDNKFSLVTGFQVLHHVENIDNTLKELYRIMKINGYLIIREHDLDSNLQRTLIDVEHGLYEMNDIDWFNNYEAYYKSKDDWIKLLQYHKFEYIQNIKYTNSLNDQDVSTFNQTRYFYMVFRKDVIYTA